MQKDQDFTHLYFQYIFSDEKSEYGKTLKFITEFMIYNNGM